MSSANFTSTRLDSKYRGCLIGALVGDCLGFPYEFCTHVKAETLNIFLSDLINEGSEKMLNYSDDSSMTISVASSLVEKGEINAKDMAKKFVDAYYSEPVRRGYGSAIPRLFKALKETNYEDVFLPAKLQFNGSGSYGNGAAMRIAPIALFGNSKGEQFIIDAVKECSHITHTHPNGYNGAILQCLAVNAVLGLDPSKALDPVSFINSLQEKMENIESEVYEDYNHDTHLLIRLVSWLFKQNPKKPFCGKLEKVKEFLQSQDDISSEKIAECLGNHVVALESVATAIYAFLRGMNPLEGYAYESSNPYMRTLYFAISMGMDTDTIASMAGAIAGAYYGEDIIPKDLQRRCEAIDKVINLADKLFEARQESE